MLLRNLCTWLCVGLLALHTSHQGPQTARAWDFNDIIDTGSGIIEDLDDFFEDLANTVATAFTSLGAALTGVATKAANWLAKISPEAQHTLTSIYKIGDLATDVIEDVLDGFNATTWRKLAKGAKFVLYELEELVDDNGEKLASYIKEYLQKGANFLADLADIDDYLPFPFDVVEVKDFYSVVECVDDLVLESAIQFAENVATTVVDLGDDFDITPIFNTEDIQDELNATYKCLLEIGQELKTREGDTSDDDNIIADYLQDALAYFEFEEVVHGIEFGFTACTLVCGTASIGFAVAPDSYRFAPYYTVASGVETSSVVGASIEAGWRFWPRWENAIGSRHIVSFDVSIGLPLIPISFGTTVSAAINDSGTFGGFRLQNDILDVSFGFNGAFGLGYAYESAYWIESLSDLKASWNAFYEVGEIVAEQVKFAVAAFDAIKDVLGSGGYLVSDEVDVDATRRMRMRRSLLQSDSVTLTCPSSSDANAGNSSALELGLINVHEVIFGYHNLSSPYFCNSSSGFAAVYEECAWKANCSLEKSVETFGDPGCADEANLQSYTLDIIYTCPKENVATVYNAGCYKTTFWDVVEAGWIMDGTSGYDFLEDAWDRRDNAIAKCSKIAGDMGYTGFAIYNGGMCLAGSDLLSDGVYNALDSASYSEDSDSCPVDGLGSSDTMNIYVFATDTLAFEDHGCFNTSFVEQSLGSSNSLTSAEDSHPLTQDTYSSRKMKVSKCAQVALESGYGGFALLDDGACHMSNGLEAVTDADTNDTYNCGSGSGNSRNYNVYTFPTSSLDVESSGSGSSDDEGLSGGAIAGIVIGIIVLVAVAVVAGMYFVRKGKAGSAEDGADASMNYAQMNA